MSLPDFSQIFTAVPGTLVWCHRKRIAYFSDDGTEGARRFLATSIPIVLKRERHRPLTHTETRSTFYWMNSLHRIQLYKTRIIIIRTELFHD